MRGFGCDARRVGFEPTIALPMTSPIRCIKQLRLDRYPLTTQETALDPAYLACCLVHHRSIIA